jgi:putative oxidoreductase
MTMKANSDLLALVGRVLLGLIFVVAGWGKLTGFAGAVGYIASKGLPMPELLAAVAVAFELGGGLALVVGFKARWAALAIAVFMIVITPIFHNFWDAPAAQAMNQQIHFLKNVSILGGILMVMAFGPGRFSLDKG